jgi:hypothetical protein
VVLYRNWTVALWKLSSMGTLMWSKRWSKGVAGVRQMLWLLGLRFFLAATILVLDSRANELPNQEIEETKKKKKKKVNGKSVTACNGNTELKHNEI